MKKYRVFLGLLVLCVLGVGSVWAWRSKTTEPSAVSFEWLIEPKLSFANDFSHGVAWIQEEENGPWKLIDHNGNFIKENFSAEFIWRYGDKTALAPFELEKHLYGYLDISGDIAISPEYRFAGIFKGNIAIVGRFVSDEVKFGLIDCHGNSVLPTAYDNLYVLHDNLFAVEKDGKWGYLNAKGKVLWDLVFEKPFYTALPSGVCMAVVDGKAGLIDEGGRWILPASYDAVYRSGEGLIGLARDGKVGFVDVAGNTVIDFQFFPTERNTSDILYTFSEGLSFILLPIVNEETTKREYGVIDRSGSLIFSFQDSPVTRFTKGFFVARSPDGIYVLMDCTGNRYPFPHAPLGWQYRFPFWQEGFSERVLRVSIREKSKKADAYRHGYLRVHVDTLITEESVQ